MFGWDPQPRRSEADYIGSFAAGCLSGLVVGVAMGILMAPHRGQITRRKLARQAAGTRDQVMEAVEEMLADDDGGSADAET